MTSCLKAVIEKPNCPIPECTKLESGIDLSPLIPLAQKEGNSKKPIYQMHKWWARRLGVNFRFLLLSATMRSNIQNKTIWKKFYQNDTELDLTVLDPFMGGGTSIVEATKIGARTIGVDLDPMAWFIVNKQIAEIDEISFKDDWNVVQRDIADKIQEYYKTKVRGKSADVIYYFWVEIIPCASCGHEFEGHIHYLLFSKKNNYGSGPRRMAFCKKCHKPHEILPGENQFRCSCGEITEVNKGNLYLGRYTCPNCHYKGKISDLAVDRLPLKHHLFAVEYINPDTGQRAYKKADKNDQKLYEKACRDLKHLWSELPIPEQSIPIVGRYDPRPVSFGYKKYFELFNKRQLLCLALILREILKVKNIVNRELLLLAFSDSLACNNVFCSYAFGYQKLTPLFGLHAFRRISRPVEGNVWGADLGRGSFSSSVEKVLRGKRFGAKPFEYKYENGQPKRVESNYPAQATIVDDIEKISKSKSRSTYLTIADSRDLSWIPEKSVDVVLTDPPYYNNLPYSEMSDFYYVWLKDHVRWAGNDIQQHSPIKDSLFVRNNGEDEHFRYKEGLTRAFTWCHKALKDDGIMIFTYHHANRNAWESLMIALRHSNFHVTNCFPVLAEGKSGFHSDHGNLKWDIVFVCRPKCQDNTPEFRPGPCKRWFMSHLTMWESEVNSGGFNLREADRRNLAFGLMTSYLTTCKISDERSIDTLKSIEEKFPLKKYERIQFSLDD